MSWYIASVLCICQAAVDVEGSALGSSVRGGLINQTKHCYEEYCPKRQQ